jgi:hypothetical protein
VITRVHVNQHVIRSNRQTGDRQPVLSVKRGGRTIRAHSVEILGSSRLVYSPDKPLSCGATVWVETDGEVVVA